MSAAPRRGMRIAVERLEGDSILTKFAEESQPSRFPNRRIRFRLRLFELRVPEALLRAKRAIRSPPGSQISFPDRFHRLELFFSAHFVSGRTELPWPEYMMR